jgi:bis(5'-nucleosidyl)-tetraphosphatase
MNEEYSSGGIVYRIENEQPQFLLIKNAAFKDPNKTYWGFPKGHLEEGESSAQAALREVEEETNVKVEIVELVDEIEYTYNHPVRGLTKKRVDYFLMRYLEGEEKPQEKEILELGWFFASDALDMLSFSQNKTLLKKALAKLKGDE